MQKWVVLSASLAACAAPRQLTARDADLAGREILVSVEAVPGGYRLSGRMRTSVPPGVLAALTTRPREMVALFRDHVAGAGRWPAGAEDRFFFAARLFGRIFGAWGHLARTLEGGRATVRWRTDRGARGSAVAERRGAGSEVLFEGFFPAHVDLARFLPRFGVELLLKIVGFAVRARLELLWRERKLSEGLAPADAAWAGIAPSAPRPVGGPR